MAVSSLVAAGGASEALPLGATAKVASGYAATGGWKYNTSTAAGTYQLTVQSDSKNIYGIKTANGVQVGNITGGSTVPFKTTSTESSITIGSLYPYEKSQLTTIGSTLRAVNGGNGLFILVSNDGYLYTSTDGLSWTNRTTGTEGTTPNANVPGYVNDRWIVPGWSNGTTSANILYSTDGVTWSQRDLSAMGGARINQIGYGNGYWYALASNASTTSNVYRSTNFSTWSSITVPSTAAPYSYVYANWQGTNFHIIGAGGGAVWYSADATNFTAASVGANDIHKVIPAGNTRMLAVGITGNSTGANGLFYNLNQNSTSGVPDTWAGQTINNQSTIPGTVITGNYIFGMYILMFSGSMNLETTLTAQATQIGGYKCMLSKDGYTWTIREMPRNHTNLQGQPLDHANGVICYSAGSGQVYYTTAYNSAAFHITSTALTSV